MEQTDGVRAALEAAAGVLWRSALIGYALLLVWFLVYLLAGEWMFHVHRALMGIERPDFVRLNYEGMALVKLVVFLFFLTPFLSIRWYLARRPTRHPQS